MASFKRGDKITYGSWGVGGFDQVNTYTLSHELWLEYSGGDTLNAWWATRDDSNIFHIIREQDMTLVEPPKPPTRPYEVGDKVTKNGEETVQLDVIGVYPAPSNINDQYVVVSHPATDLCQIVTSKKLKLVEK